MYSDISHLGTERVYQLAKQRVYWPRMHVDIEKYIKEQCSCVVQKKRHIHQDAPLQSIHSSAPMELIAIDYLHLDKSSSGMEYVLLITDNFTRFSQAYATKNKSATTAAKHLYNDFILRFGLPWRVMHDQGKEFEAKLFSELEHFSGISKSRTTPYHPQGNGVVERMNSTLLSMLRTLEEGVKSKWHLYLNKLLFAYNSTVHNSTGFSPHFLMFGREPILTIDFILGIEDEKAASNYGEFTKKWKEQMEEAYKTALMKSTKRKEQDAIRRAKKHISLSESRVGDHVLVRKRWTR